METKAPMSVPSLSDEEIDALWHEHSQNTGPSLRLAGNNISRFARAIEAKVCTLRAGQPVAWIQPWALDLFRDDKNAYSQPVVPEQRSPWEIPLYLGGAGQSEPVAMRIWIDTEFNEHAHRHELISLALVADDGKEWYEVLPCQWPDPWVAENVMPKLGKAPVGRACFAETLREFLAQYKAVHIIGDWPTDIALFCDALIVSPGCRIDTPPLTFEVIRLDGESADPHNALADARSIRDVHRAALASIPTDGTKDIDHE